MKRMDQNIQISIIACFLPATAGFGNPFKAALVTTAVTLPTEAGSAALTGPFGLTAAVEASAGGL